MDRGCPPIWPPCQLVGIEVGSHWDVGSFRSATPAACRVQEFEKECFLLVCFESEHLSCMKATTGSVVGLESGCSMKPKCMAPWVRYLFY